MTNEQIELISRNLLRDMWAVKEELLDNKASNEITYFDILSPELMCKYLRVQYCESDTLNNVVGIRGQRKVRTAGEFCREDNYIMIAADLSREVSRFTGAHEVGHFMLHDNMRTYHRDMPIDSKACVTFKNNRTEAEANHFAGCILIPAILLRRVIKEKLGIDTPLRVTDAMAFHLDQHDPDSIIRASKDSKTREYALASLTRDLNGNHMMSLAEVFGVSNTAMAIRLKELGIFIWP